MLEHKWYFGAGYYYFELRTETLRHIFFMDNLEMANFVVTEINQAKDFY
jgi:hypothetical protein